MVSVPLLIGFAVKDSDATVLANVQVTCRNETTNQAKTDNTASDGKIIFNLGSTADFSKGWNVSDKINVFSLYRGFQQDFSFTIPASGTAITVKDSSGVTVGTFRGGMGMDVGTLILVVVPSLPSIRYFIAQEFLDYFNMKTTDVDAENGINLLQLAKIGEMVENDIDNDTQSKFDSNSGSYYSSSDMDGGESPEYHDVLAANQNSYYLKFIPVQTLTTFEVNENAEGGTASWDTLTEADNEISVDKQTGRVKIIDSGEYPATGARQVRATYVFGRSSAPKDIKLLAIIETGMAMFGSTFLKNKITKFSGVDVGDIVSFQTFRAKIIRKYRNHTLLAS